jgi:hypothetical protein
MDLEGTIGEPGDKITSKYQCFVKLKKRVAAAALCIHMAGGWNS